MSDKNKRSEEQATKTSRLKPCPFCGGEVDLESHIDVYGREYFFVECRNEQCYVTPFTDGFRTESEAINIWNTRKPIEEIVERLEERTDFLKDCTEYGNKNIEQMIESYSTMMKYEVASLVEDLIDIVKEEVGE